MNRTHFKRATALTLVVTLVLCQGFVTGMPLRQVVSKVQRYVSGAGNVMATRSAAKLPRTAHLSAHGAVTLDGHAAPTGATVFSGGGVKTAEDSTAVLSFGAMGQVELASTSDFTLAVEGTTLGGQLRAGSATIVASAGVAVKVVTADGPVVTDGREAVVLTVDVLGGKTRVETNNPFANIKTPAGVTPMPPNQAKRVKLSAEQLKSINERLARIRRAAVMINQKGGTINMADVDALEASARQGDKAGFEAALKRILATKPPSQTSLQNMEPMDSAAESKNQHGPYSSAPPEPTIQTDLYEEIQIIGEEIIVEFQMGGGYGGGAGGGGGYGGGAGGGGGGLGALAAIGGLMAAGITVAESLNDSDNPALANPVSPITP